MSASTTYRPAARTEISRLRKDLDELLDRTRIISDIEISGDLNRYVCVRVSGFLERCLQAAARSCCERQNIQEAKSFSMSWLQRIPNPRAEEIESFVARFNREWADEFHTFLEQEERRSSVNALLGIRNDIAHGKNQGVSQTQAREYYDLVVLIADWLLDHFEPMPRH